MTSQQQSDEGFSMVEVIIAVTLLGLLAVAILPALVIGLSITRGQASTVIANRKVNEIIELARETPNCAFLQNGSSSFGDNPFNERGTSFSYTVTIGTCSSGLAVPFAAQVASEGKTLAEAKTLIFIP